MNWIDETLYSGKPGLKWIDSYVREDGKLVDGHFRTEANETVADNLSFVVDNDGINGYFDADADGDGVFESLDLDQDGISDSLEIDSETLMDSLTDLI